MFTTYLSSNYIDCNITTLFQTNIHLLLSVSPHLLILTMVSTRSSSVTPGASSSTSAPNPAQQSNAQPDVNLAGLLVQQSQLLQRMEQRLANLEAHDQLLASSAATSAATFPMQAPLANNPAPYTHPVKDPSERIKTAEVPKFHGKKEVEAWIIKFKKYCRLLKLRSKEHSNDR